MPTWAEVVFLVCAVGFILALKGLSGPKTARAGNLVGAGAAVVACVVPFFYADLDNVALIEPLDYPHFTRLPQMVALFNGVGGGAAALVALLELEHFADAASLGVEVDVAYLVATAFTILVGAVSFSGSVITFAKLQDLMTSRPGVFPGLPFAFGGTVLAGLVLSGLIVAEDGDA